MRRFLVVLCCLLIPLFAAAQQRSGNIYGTVVDSDRTPLPGVSVTLTGPTIAPMTTVTSAEGKFRFLSLFPGNDYVIKAELQGFKVKIESGVIVNVARTAEITVVLEQGALEEQVTVVAKTPVVDPKKTQITHTVTYEMLQDLPSARDPWVVLQMAPAIQMDRENIGGVDSGQQSSFVARGATANEWTVDGMQITDRNSGGSPTYYDFDSFEEMNISTGTLDVEHRDPGVVINMVTRRGGNKLSLGGRFYWTNSKFQTTISDTRLAELNLTGYNRANDIKDFGFNAGGPFVKDKAWWWLSYGIQQVKTFNTVNVADDTYLNNYGGKLNFQLIPSNRLEVLYQLNDKVKFGRSSSEYFVPGWRQGSKGYFGAPIFKVQDEQMFGNNLFLSVRAGTSNGGFGMKPENDLDAEKVAYYDYAGGFFYNSYYWFYSDRPHPYGVLQAQYFNDKLFGASHEIKVGFEVNNNSRTYYGNYDGNSNMYVAHDYNTRTVDWNGDGTRDVVLEEDGFDLARIQVRRYDTGYHDGTKRLAAYFNDTISTKRFNFNVGLRFDWAKDYVSENIYRSLWSSGDAITYPLYSNYAAIADEFFGGADTVGKIQALMPDTSTPYVTPPKTFWLFSPRLGITYDLFGNGKTILKLAYSLYPGGGLGTGYNMPFGQYGWIRFWWADGYGYGANVNGDNPDGVATWDELYWASYNSSRTPYHAFDTGGAFVGNVDREYGYMYSGCTLGQTDLAASHTSVDLDNWKTDLTHEFNISVEHEIFQDFGVSLSFNYKRMGRFSWTLDYYPEIDHIRSKDDYIVAGTVPTMLDNGEGQTFPTGDAAGRPWYVLTGEAEGLYTDYARTVMMDPKRHNTYWGIDFVFTKRLSHKWMFNGSVTYQDQRSYFGDYGYTDPTNLWASEGQIYAFDMGGGSGKITRPFFTRWMFKMSGLYQMPFEINVSGTVSAHQGTYYQTYFDLEDDALPNPDSISNAMATTKYNDRTHLGNVWVVNLKIEKMLKLGNVGKMYFSADIFNSLNLHTILRKRDIHYGTFYYYDQAFDGWASPSDTSGFNNEVLNPLLVRLGMRFQF
jgi:Carboxypeptidase regulatory-like domain